MEVMKPSLLLLIVQQDEKCLEQSTSLEETYVSAKKSMKKVRSQSKLASKPSVVHIAYSAAQLIHMKLRHDERAKI